MCEHLESCETLTCFGLCKPHVTEPQRIERICLLKLELGNLVSQLNGDLVEVMVALDVCTKAPIIEEGGFDNKGRERGGLRAQELDKPVGEDIGIGLDRDDGIGKEGMKEQLLVVSPECTGSVLTPLEIFDEGGLYGLSINGTDNEVREAAIVGLKALRALSKSEEAGEREGVVACSYVGKLLLERCHLLSPHSASEGLLGCKAEHESRSPVDLHR